jgi:F-type H+-transporting ATPase subunit c
MTATATATKNTKKGRTRINRILTVGPWANCGGSQKQRKVTMTGSIHIGLAAIGSAIGVGIIGMKAAEATGRNPGAAGAIRNQAIIFAALAEGIIFFAIFLGKMGM